MVETVPRTKFWKLTSMLAIKSLTFISLLQFQKQHSIFAFRNITTCFWMQSYWCSQSRCFGQSWLRGGNESWANQICSPWNLIYKQILQTRLQFTHLDSGTLKIPSMNPSLQDFQGCLSVCPLWEIFLQLIPKFLELTSRLLTNQPLFHTLLSSIRFCYF